MKSLLAATLAAAGVMALSASQPKETSQAGGDRFIRIDGPNLVKPDGEKFFIQGTNLGNWLNPEGYMFGFKAPASHRKINELFCELAGEEFTADFWQQFKDNYITADDINFIARTGMNTLRIPFHYKLFTNEDYMGLNDSTEGFRRLDKVIDQCRDAGLYVILDMHDAPGGQTGDNIDDSHGYPWLMLSERQQQKCCDIWQRIAAHYANDTIVLGYDLLNEPIAHYPTDDLPRLNAALEPLYRRITAAIRKADKNHIVMLGGAQWNGNFKPLSGEKFDDKIMFTCHRYWCDLVPECIGDFVAFRDSVNLPMYMGETGENTDEWIAGFTKIMNDNNISWTYWPYKKLDSTRGVMSIPTPENWHRIQEYAEADRRSLAKIREAKFAPEIAQKAMSGLIENLKYRNCTPNPGYIQAMGMTVPEK